MANISRQARGVNVTWGTDSANVVGLCVSATLTTNAERIPVLDNNGVPVGTIYVPNYAEASYEIMVENTTNVPNVGDNMTVAGQSVYIESVEQQWQQKGIKKLMVKGAALPS